MFWIEQSLDWGQKKKKKEKKRLKSGRIKVFRLLTQ